MHNFEKRRDRYERFAAYANPLVNLSFDMTVPDFRPWCKAQQLPPFHFFLYCVLHAVKGIDNFMYRIHHGDVIKIDDFWGSYTVINHEHNVNYARFLISPDLREFIARSLEAKRIAEATGALSNASETLSERERKNNIHITSMPWLKLNAIQHPVFDYKTYDIPSLAWGKFGAPLDGEMTLPFSVQAHHGFVDGDHVHLLAEAIAARIAQLIA